MSPALYDIRVQCHLERNHWSRWFDGPSVALNVDGTTVLSGNVDDQVALHGFLGRVRDLGVI